MCLYIASLNSGSNGNCYYVGNDTEAVLIDAGISCKETEKRMARCGLSMSKVKAIFISHEHGDHIAGLEMLSKKYNLPVYISTGTLPCCGVVIDKTLIYFFDVKKPVMLGGLAIQAFAKTHDANDPHSFTVSCEGVTVGIFTDIGVVCKQVSKHFMLCHAVFLEANYDEAMLQNGSYPWHLKRRISGGKGHLSNAAALQLFIAHKPVFMSHLILAHLSKNNNCPQLAENLFLQHAGNTKIVVASRYCETPVFTIYAENDAHTLYKERHTQLSLF